jgi:hypothetical protein
VKFTPADTVRKVCASTSRAVPRAPGIGTLIQRTTMPLDYELVKKTFADKLSQDFAGQGRFESAFYHTIQFVYGWANDERAYDFLLLRAELSAQQQRIAELEGQVRMLGGKP